MTIEKKKIKKKLQMEKRREGEQHFFFLGGLGTALARMLASNAIGRTDPPKVVRFVRGDVGGGNHGSEDGLRVRDRRWFW